MSEQNLFTKQGQVSAREIKQARDELRGVLIVPFAKENAKGIGYDLRALDFVFSLKKRCLERIYQSPEGRFVSISPKDTVLILTYEYVKLDGNLSGFVFSKVRNVSKGLGHVSTTIDPNWAGMLLLAINNGSSKRIRLPITYNQGGREYRHGLVTMVLNVMEQNPQDPLQLALTYPAMRLDILDQLVSEPGHLRRNHRYQSLKRLLQELSELEKKKQPNEPWLLEAKQNLVDLKYKRSTGERIYLIDKLIWSLPQDTSMLKKRIQGLREAANDGISVSEWENLVEMALKECEYELLCKHIDAIHSLIDQYTPKNEQKPWKRVLLFLKNHSIPLLVYFFALMLIILCFFLKPEYLNNNAAFSIALLSVIVPPLLTRFLSTVKWNNRD